MKLTIYSRTPLAAAPIDVSLVNNTDRYNDGRIFPHHLLLASSNGNAMRALQESEVWHVHNYLTPQLIVLRKNHKVIAQFHSLPRLGNWQQLMNFADVSYTIRQPNQEKEYKLKGLPNVIDPDEYRPVRRKLPIKIAFAPSTRLAVGHPGSKGYNEVRVALNNVARKRDVQIVWIERRFYVENLEMKQQSHILIDDVVTGNWHRTSLEGMCFGCAVLNKVAKSPFVYATLDTLEERLLWLVDNPEILNDFQERSRFWVLQHWHAIDQVKEYVHAYREALR